VFHQGSNTAPESEKGLIDITSFTSSFIYSTGSSNVFATRQINEVQFTSLQKLFAVDGIFLDVNGDRKDGMGSTGTRNEYGNF
jgi:hypothetical protein